VLSKFSKEDQAIVGEAIEKCVNAVEGSLSKPFLDVMNHFNG
jgi:PTH1 family peptidyl-tRNA hydrolase